MADLADLAEMLFPDNRNQQHAFTAVWLAIKWSPHRMVPNLHAVAMERDISRRTMERVRAKMRRMGLLDHVSRFNKSFGYQEGWILSTRFASAVGMLSDKVDSMKDPQRGSRDKDMMILELASVRSRVAQKNGNTDTTQDDASASGVIENR